MDQVTLPTCRNCPRYYHHLELSPKNIKGKTLQYGDRICSGKKGKSIKFKRSDPKNKPPKWCPMRKTPCEVRIYEFQNATAAFFYLLSRNEHGEKALVSGYQYALSCTTTTSLTPKMFWERQKYEPIPELLGVELPLYGVVEIDDGLMPYFFFRGEHGLRIESSTGFDEARKHTKEENIDSDKKAL